MPEGIVTGFQGTVTTYLGGEAEARVTPSGKDVADVSAAVGGGRSRDGGERKEPFWLKLTFWEEMALWAVDNCRKGLPLKVIGRVTDRKYLNNDKKDRREIILTVDRIFEWVNSDWQELILEKKGSTDEKKESEKEKSGSKAKR